MNKIQCQICTEFISTRKFKNHLQEHNITEQMYYDKFLRSSVDSICPICGKSTKFKDVFKGYNKYCSRACLNKSSMHISSVKSTKLARYGDEYYTNSAKIKETWTSKSIEDKRAVVDKVKATKLQRYGSETYNNHKKYEETCMQVYGVACPFENEDISMRIREKYYAKDKETKRAICVKRRRTVDNKSYQEKQAIAQKHRDVYFNKTELEKDRIKQKSYLTKKKNHSFKTSKLETTCYNALVKIYPNTKHGYKSKDYPYVCDLYIPELDLYIELNFHWTHGNHPYGTNSNDPIKLLSWIEKAKSSTYYNNAINVWTVRDVEKVNLARNNKLHLLVFYTKNEFDVWLSQLMQ